MLEGPQLKYSGLQRVSGKASKFLFLPPTPLFFSSVFMMKCSSNCCQGQGLKKNPFNSVHMIKKIKCQCQAVAAKPNICVLRYLHISVSVHLAEAVCTSTQSTCICSPAFTRARQRHESSRCRFTAYCVLKWRQG